MLKSVSLTLDFPDNEPVPLLPRNILLPAYWTRACVAVLQAAVAESAKERLPRLATVTPIAEGRKKRS